MPLDISTISDTEATIGEAESAILYGRVFVDKQEDYRYYDSSTDWWVRELVSVFCNKHAWIETPAGTLHSPIPKIIYRFHMEEDGSIITIEGAWYDNGAFAFFNRGSFNSSTWQLGLAAQTANLYHYPTPS